jgi:Bacterial protein of unknown function (DUF899)
MALKGSPRDMDKWRAVLLEQHAQFPAESAEYRRARNQLLAAEDALRQLTQQVAAERRALPAGGYSRPCCRWSSSRARPAHRSSTGSRAPPSTSPSGSTWS